MLTPSMFLLDRAKARPARFLALQPRIVSSVSGVRQSVADATRDTLWVSYQPDLTDAVVRSLRGPSRRLGNAVLIHAINPQTLAALTGSFHRLAFADHDGFLPPDELAEVLRAENRSDLFLGGSVDPVNQVITLWRGNLESLTVPFAAFEPSGDGLAPDFNRFAVTDYGQTIRLGHYESAADALLYEFDPDYRRRIARERQRSERSLGASLRRLRKQRGLRREDFQPQISAKTIARIEQGQIRRLQQRTRDAIAQRLAVSPQELETY
jgi:hypothetical protein